MQIMLIDDHAIFRDGLKFVLSDLDDTIEFIEAGTCEEALVFLRDNNFDLILLDLNLPDSKGTDTLKTFREQFDESPIVVLTGEDNPQLIRQAIELGASGFIPKSSSSKVLTSALHLVLNGGVYLPPNALDGLLQTVEEKESPPPPPSSVLSALSERQQQVLMNAIQGKANKIIAREMCISEGTVKSHLSQAFRALGVRNRTEAVYAASRLGISVKIPAT